MPKPMSELDITARCKSLVDSVLFLFKSRKVGLGCAKEHEQDQDCKTDTDFGQYGQGPRLKTLLDTFARRVCYCRESERV